MPPTRELWADFFRDSYSVHFQKCNPEFRSILNYESLYLANQIQLLEDDIFGQTGKILEGKAYEAPILL